MRTLLVGNGIDIQYGGKEYLNTSIIERAIKNLDDNNFNPEVYTKEVGELFMHLYVAFNEVISGKYDKYIATSYEKKSLTDFKKRYKKIKKIKHTNIGIEDYMFIYDLFCRKNNVFNPQQFEIRELLKRWILDSIYNEGRIYTIYQKFPLGLKEFFLQYDNLFTTNYDNNIELFTGREVGHLHGAFNVLSYVYDENSFRNRLSDSPVSDCPVVEGYEHLFSTALMSFTGELKEFSMNMATSANSAIDKFVEGIQNSEEIATEVNTWKDSDNLRTRNLYESIILKSRNKDLSFNEEYPIEPFKNIYGEIDIIGLSPNNDIHLFELINNNEGIDKVTFYYYDKSEILDIRKTLNKKTVDVSPVKEVWKKYDNDTKIKLENILNI